MNQSSSTASGTTGLEPPDPGDVTRCEDPSLDWRSGRKTYYTSYPEPGSDECENFNGCHWEGRFAACGSKMTEEWVSQTDIVAVFPMYEALQNHELCIRSGERVMVVNVIDTCNDADCSGCCTQNLASYDALIDLESYTNARWGLPDGELQWADLGPRADPICN